MNPGKPSFFDSDIVASITKIWEPVKKKEPEIFLKDIFQKKSRKSPNYKQITLELGSQHLYYSKNNSHNNGKLYLVLAKLDVLTHESNLYGFRITRNQQVVEFFTESQSIFNKWRNQLVYKCFQSTFHEEFFVSKMIGKGSFAKVYLAQKKSTNVEYAIKAFNKEFMLEQYKGKESLENEIKVMRQLNHENLVRLYEVYETQNSIYFVLDVLKGGELLNRVKQKGSKKKSLLLGALSKSDLQRLMYNLMKALAHIHRNNCVHRDLKPENLLLKNKENDFDLVIADFGLAAFLDDNILFKRCGTPGFVAPEILLYKEGEPFYTQNCDVFSAGIIFYLLLTGKQPFQGKDYKEILRANKSCEINMGLKQILGAESAIQDLLKRMLHADPTRRITSEDCLKHEYFQKLTLDNQPAADGLQENLAYYEKDFLYGLKKKSEDSQEQIGSMELKQRSIALNGKIDTIGSLSTYSNSSISKFEQLNQKPIGASKFSQFSQKAQQQMQQQPGSIQEVASSPSNRVSKQQDLHKKAIKNSLYSKQKQEEEKKNEDDTVTDEDPQLQKVMSQLQQGEIKLMKSNFSGESPKNKHP